MPILGFLLFLLFVLSIAIYTFINVWMYVKTREKVYLKSILSVGVFVCVVVGLYFYGYNPITKDRVVGVYEIDNRFYPGENADWQKEHFSFEITEDSEFLFNEKLKDGSIKTIRGKVDWYRVSPPMLYRIVMEREHPLVDEHPSLYRGNRKFYYVFETKYGNMFYRKVE